ncbi:MAG: hypothetical protein FJ096_17740 [Deltaproteobacteria bacterium]|nr:hypothetical protein [Deltaproteobacteria bacterium]
MTPQPSVAGRERTAWISTTVRDGCAPPGCAAEACGLLVQRLEQADAEDTPASRRPPRVTELATALLERTCRVGAPPEAPPRGVVGCDALGRRRVAAGEHAAARAYLEAACEGGVRRGCVGLGDFVLARPSPSPADEKTAHALSDRACEAGELDACTRLGSSSRPRPGGSRTSAARSR